MINERDRCYCDAWEWSEQDGTVAFRSFWHNAREDFRCFVFLFPSRLSVLGTSTMTDVIRGHLSVFVYLSQVNTEAQGFPKLSVAQWRMKGHLYIQEVNVSILGPGHIFFVDHLSFNLFHSCSSDSSFILTVVTFIQPNVNLTSKCLYYILLNSSVACSSGCSSGSDVFKKKWSVASVAAVFWAGKPVDIHNVLFILDPVIGTNLNRYCDIYRYMKRSSFCPTLTHTHTH